MKRALSILAIIAVAITPLFSSACGKDDGSGYIFKYDIVGNPRTLDPQTASSSSAYIVIENLFEGLLRLDENGAVTNGAASSYEVSDNGLCYTFTLRDDLSWSDGDKFEARLTAADFVFGFRRLFNPATKSSHAEEFYCIKNSEKINKGAITDFSVLGVRAIDELTLEIVLDYPNPLFPVLLTTSPAMPCNEEFFISAEGRYGLINGRIASNGAFTLFSWSYDEWSDNNNNIILRKNKTNDDVERIYPYGLNFFIDEPDPLANFKNGEAHSLIADGDNAVSLIAEEYSYTENDTAVWGLAFNTAGVFGNENLRLAAAMGFDPTGLFKGIVGYSSAEGVIPPSIMLGDDYYRELAGKSSIIDYDAKSAGNYFAKGLSETGYGSVDGLTIICPENDVIYRAIKTIMQDWQANLGFFCTVKSLPEAQYNAALTEKSYDIAAIKLSGDYNSPSAYLNAFIGDKTNLTSYQNADFSREMTLAERAETVSDSLSHYKSAESLLLSDGVFIPLCCQSEYFFLAEHCEDIVYNPFTESIVYRNAKYIK